jgi:DNA-binding Lrp family transcriptional regulator
MERDRVTVGEAARRLGISESGVRKRVKREQLFSTREDGRVYVYLDTPGLEEDTVPDSVPDKYVERLEDEVAYLREMLRREQEINAMHASNMRALSGPEEPDSTVVERQGESPDHGDRGSEDQPSRPWWRRIFGS